MLPNQVYYFEVGKGEWGGQFDFRITDAQAYRRISIGAVNRLLIAAMRFVIAVLGRPSIASVITVDETEAPAGTARNTYRISKVGVTLCKFHDVYRLDPDGEDVAVTTDISYGPVPGVINDYAAYTARITDGGYRSCYQGLRLLGATWVARYEVAPDRNHVSGTLTCAWGEAREQMFRRTQ